MAYWLPFGRPPPKPALQVGRGLVLHPLPNRELLAVGTSSAVCVFTDRQFQKEERREQNIFVARHRSHLGTLDCHRICKRQVE